MSIPARVRRSELALFFLGLICALGLPAFAAPQLGIAPKNSKRDQEAAARGQGTAGELVSGGAELRFPVMHVHGGMTPSGCYGYLYFSRDSVRYEVLGPDKFKDHSFERSRADVVKVSDPGFFRKFPEDLAVQFRNGQTETFDHVNAQEVEKDRKAPLFGKYLLPREPLMLAFSNFDQALVAAGGTPGSPGSAVASAGYGTAATSGAPISAAAPPPALPAPTPSAGFYADARIDFDTLDGVTVDPQKGTFTLLGHRAGNGAARPVPYLDYFAAAMESNNPTFSLEWTPDSSRSIDRAFQMADQDLTNRLAGTVDATGHLTDRGEWWYRMLGADVRQGMDKMSLWTAVFAATGYPNTARVMKAVDAIERAGKGNPSQNQSASLLNDFFNATVNISMPNLDFQTFAQVSLGAHNGNAQARETYFSWGLRGMAIAYKVDPDRYWNNYLSYERSGMDWGTAFAKALELSQDDTVQVQKNAFYALVGNRTFVHVPPEIMRQVLGVSPIVVPVYQGLRPDSLLARVAFEADVFGKNLMDMPEIKSDVPAYRTYFEWRQTVPRAPAAEGHTWFAPDGFELFESADGKTLRFGKTPVRIHMERYQNGGASGRQSVEDPLLRQYADELTALYDPLAAKFPILLDLRESMKVMAVADWLKRNGIKLSFPAQGRAAWTPPTQYPGIIHMEIAVKEAPVGEVMSASGGIDFRVDQNWKLLKQRIEEQPGPPPAGHSEITENFDPASGTVAQAPGRPLQAAGGTDNLAVQQPAPSAMPAPSPLPRTAGSDVAAPDQNQSCSEVASLQDQFNRLNQQIELDRQVIKNFGFEKTVDEIEYWGNLPARQVEDAKTAFKSMLLDATINMVSGAADAIGSITPEEADMLNRLADAEGEPPLGIIAGAQDMHKAIEFLHKTKDVYDAADAVRQGHILDAAVTLGGWASKNPAFGLLLAADDWAVYEVSQSITAVATVNNLTKATAGDLILLQSRSGKLKSEVDQLTVLKKRLADLGPRCSSVPLP